MSLRYAKQDNMTKKYDFLIIGGGVAGMSFALKIARTGKYKIALCCKTTLEEANTAKAQGGIASVTNLLVDDFEKHIHDTMVAGDWLSDSAAVDVGNDEQTVRFLQGREMFFQKIREMIFLFDRVDSQDSFFGQGKTG